MYILYRYTLAQACHTIGSHTITQVIRYMKHVFIIINEWTQHAYTRWEDNTIMSTDIMLLKYHCVINFKFMWLAVAFIKSWKTIVVQDHHSSLWSVKSWKYCEFFIFFIEVTCTFYVFNYFLTRIYLGSIIFSWKERHNRFWRLSESLMILQMYRISVLYMKLLLIIKK